MTQIIPTAELFLFPGEPSKPACLLIHGFTGAPKEMRPMGEFLNQQGYTCLGIRLAARHQVFQSAVEFIQRIDSTRESI